MNLTVILVLVVIFSFGVGHLLNRYAARFISLSGAEYILVGVLIGPHFPWKLMSEAALSSFSPLISLLLGLVGFVLGLRGQETPRRLDEAVVGFVSSGLVLLGVSALVLPALIYLVPLDQVASDFAIQESVFYFRGYVVELNFGSTHLWAALATGAAATVASPMLMDSMRRVHGARGRVSNLMSAVARSSQLTAVIVLGLVLVSARATDHGTRFSLSVTEWQVAAVALGILSGLLFGLFIGRETDSNRIFLATVGLVTFASGVGAGLGVSPLFLNLVAAVTVGLTSPHAAKLRAELDRLQHALFVLVMIFAGALWNPVSNWMWALPLLYVVGRLIFRRAFTQLSARLFLEQRLRTRRLGNGLLAQGTLAVALGVDFAQRLPALASLVLTTVLIGTLLSDVFSGRALRSLLADAGELGDETEGEEDLRYHPQEPVS